MIEDNVLDESLINALRVCSGERDCRRCTYNFEISTAWVKTADGCDLLEAKAADRIEALKLEVATLKEIIGVLTHEGNDLRNRLEEKNE